MGLDHASIVHSDELLPDIMLYIYYVKLYAWCIVYRKY